VISFVKKYTVINNVMLARNGTTASFPNSITDDQIRKYLTCGSNDPVI